MFQFKLKNPRFLSKKARRICLLISLSFFCATLLLFSFYRPYVYVHNINDFHFSDSFTNFTAVPAVTFFVVALDGKMRYTFAASVMAVCLGLIAYEFIGFTFDVYDILATVVSGEFTMIGIKILFQRFEKSGMFIT